MLRQEHRFQFTGAEISKAALAEVIYHCERWEFWRSEQIKAIEKANKAGVEVREYEVTGAVNVDVVLDPTVTERLNECASKLRSHTDARDRLSIEASAYGTEPDRRYELDADDVVYFRLAGGERKE